MDTDRFAHLFRRIFHFDASKWPTSYPTRVNRIIILSNSQPSVLLIFKNSVTSRFAVLLLVKETINSGSSMNFIDEFL